MSDYGKALGSRLRAIRQQQGLSLHGVEEKSQGKWKAVVVGSYERGDRAVTVARLAELASFYDVPIVELLPDGTPGARHETPGRVVIDLEALSRVNRDDIQPLLRYTRSIQRQRGDYNGKVLTIRADDVRALSAFYDLSVSEFTDRLRDWGVILADQKVVPQDIGT
jgi:transcriptional regulator with XRE-family HTH domain